MKVKQIFGIFVFGLLGSLLVACGPNSGESEPQPVDHETTVHSLEDHTLRLSKSFTRSLEFLEGSELVDAGANGFQMQGEECSPDVDCTEEQTDVVIETDASGVRNGIVETLKETVFVEEHIVSETDTSVTYEIPGDAVCGQSAGGGGACIEDPDGNVDCETYESTETTDEACEERVDEMNYQIQVTSPSGDNLVFEVFVGSENYNPVVVELFKDHVAAEVGLGALKKTAELYDRVYEEEVASEFPSTFEGRIRGEFSRLARQKVRFETRIKSDIAIADGDYDFSLASATKPVFGVTADGDDETLTSTVDFDTIEASFPATQYEYETQGTPDQTARELQHAFHLAGLTGQMTLQGNSEEVDLENIGLGDATSWLKIGGKEVLSVDLNPDADRQFQATLRSAENADGLEVEIEPKFSLDLFLKFGRIADQLQIAPDWALDDHTEIDLGGASPSSIVLGGDYIEVLQGVLSFGSSSTQTSLEASAGECVVDADDGSTDGSSSESQHPFEYLTVAQCAN